MLKVHILSVGKNKEAWLDTAIGEYTKRLKGSVEITFTWVKDDEQLTLAAAKEQNVVCLDPNGKEMESYAFSKWLYQTSRICLVIGGASGLPEALKKYPSISLSKLTMTHQIARLVLVEQLYRAHEIYKGSPYHKD